MGNVEETPAGTAAADAERERRWGTLPDRVRLADTFAVQPVSAPPELPNPQDLERLRAVRYMPG
jgi:hypothetical protein